VERAANIGVLLLSLVVLAFLIPAAWGMAQGGLDPPEAPEAGEVVRAFREDGLPVGEPRPLEQVPAWRESPAPDSYASATRFDIPGEGQGTVFVFSRPENMRAMYDYYDNIGNVAPELESRLYYNGPVLLQIDGDVPEQSADRYAIALRAYV
jgi:hypothetical protein